MEDMSLLEALNTVLAQRRLLLGVPLLLVLIAIAVTALESRTYTSEATFIVHARQSSPVSGIAAQLGITISPSDPNQSADFYADLITSREVLDSAVHATYTLGGRQARLVDLFHAKGESAALRSDDAIRTLQKGITVDQNHRTGLITVQVRTRWPEVSQQVVARLLTIVNDFNLGMRRSQASEERAFVDQRLADAAEALRAAENRQQAFQQANRTYRDSPELSFQQERLARDVSLKQQLYTTLAQASEQARLDELRDTPFVAAVESPTIPLRPTPRPWIKRIAIALFAGLVISVLVAFMRRAMARLREEGNPEFRTLEQTLRFRA
jgi:uncharacterized protein involved in exopolysaccharide biosynthesis